MQRILNGKSITEKYGELSLPDLKTNYKIRVLRQCTINKGVGI